MRHVLLIRQSEESVSLADRLLAKDISCSLYPLLAPRFLPSPTLLHPQALMMTSKNAVRALGEHSPYRHLPLYVVGDETAAFAKKYGYDTIHNASGTVEDLVDCVSATASRIQGTLWHLSGDVVRGNLVHILREKGFDAERRIVYRMEEAQALPPSLIQELQDGRMTDVLFLSPRTATLFGALLAQAGLEGATSKMTALCLSQNVVQRITHLTWGLVWVSPKPTLDALMGYFDEKE